MRIAIFGKPGSGKGTQAALVSRRFGLVHLSSGEILRAQIRDRTPLGDQVREYVQRGEIGPERLITSAILGYMDRMGLGGGFVLDGFPRTLYQARELDAAFPIDICILLSVDDTVILDRISNRLTCTGCGSVYGDRSDESVRSGKCGRCGSMLAVREDDRPESIEKRLELFGREVRPVIEHYAESGKLIEIDGSLPENVVFSRMLESLEPLVSRSRQTDGDDCT